MYSNAYVRCPELQLSAFFQKLKLQLVLAIVCYVLSKLDSTERIFYVIVYVAYFSAFRATVHHDD